MQKNKTTHLFLNDIMKRLPSMLLPLLGDFNVGESSDDTMERLVEDERKRRISERAWLQTCCQ